MNKDDYMKLSKERLAELLEERDRINLERLPYCPPSHIPETSPLLPICPFGGNCTNQFRDCINCPGPICPSGWKITTTNVATAGSKNSSNDILYEQES
jgi:hypothetical protein